VLKLRNEKAELLGFKNFAELSMASKVRQELLLDRLLLQGGYLIEWQQMHNQQRHLHRFCAQLFVASKARAEV
jgi:Zn-dependent oligopeptidase